MSVKHKVYMKFTAMISQRISDKRYQNGYRLGDDIPHTLILINPDKSTQYIGGEVNDDEDLDDAIWQYIVDTCVLLPSDKDEILEEFNYKLENTIQDSEELTSHYYSCEVSEPVLRSLHVNIALSDNFLNQYVGAIIWPSNENNS